MLTRISLLFLISHSLLNAQQAATLDPILDGIDQQIDGVAPGIAIGVVKDGEVILEWYAGYANLEHRIKIDKHSKFNIASMAKQFTAACLLQLALQDKIDLQSDIRNYLPELYPDIKEPILISQVINHTSGIRDYCDLMSVQGDPWWRREGLDNEDVIELLSDQRSLNFEPGTQHIYSNSNYTLITALVEKVSGMSFDAYADKFFLDRNMTQTSFSTNYMDVIDNLASPYSNWGGPKWKLYPMMTDLHGDGFLYTTLPDQLVWEVMLQQHAKDPLVMSSQRPIEDSDYKAYGYGLEFDDYKGNKRVHHAGGTGSYGSEVMRFPDKGLSIIVMSNSGSLWASGIAADLADHYLATDQESNSYPRGPQRISKRPSFDSIVGTYELEDRTIMRIVRKNDYLYREIEGRNPVLLVSVEGNLFEYANNPDLRIAFVPNRIGSFDFLLYHPQIEQRLGRRLPQLTNPSPKSLDGLYSNDELDVSLEVSHVRDNTYQISIWDRDYEVAMLEEGQLRFNGFTANFERNTSGQVTQLLLDYNRLRSIRFAKIRQDPKQ